MKNFTQKFIGLLALVFLMSISINAQDRIVGGEDVDIKYYSWQAALVTSYGTGYCGASVISDTWILTAAHCVDGDDASNLFVRVGASALYASGGQTYSSASIIVHPLYNGSASNGYDIALIQLNDPITFNSSVQPIEIISSDETYLEAAGLIATTTGWGSLYSDGPSPNVLQMVGLPIVANDVACGSATDSNGNTGAYLCNQIDETMICAGVLGEGGMDACQGDSGGPLVVRNSDDTDWLLVGATSWGYGCADANYPGIWSSVSYFHDWINGYANLYDSQGNWIYSTDGCMDESACNYNASAVQDYGSCLYASATFDCDGNCLGEQVQISMTDSYGDGWNGNFLSIMSEDSLVSMDYTLAGGLSSPQGSAGNAQACVDSGCNTITIGGGLFPDEVSWVISGADGAILAEGGAPETVIACFVATGCMDESACNYDASAVQENGSCLYASAQFDCDGNCLGEEVQVTMTDSYGDGWNLSTLTVGDVMVGLNDGSEGTAMICINMSACNTLVVSSGVFASEIGWSIGNLSGGAPYNGTIGNCDPEPDPQYGCTEEGATNYNPDANTEDGSCEYYDDDIIIQLNEANNTIENLENQLIDTQQQLEEALSNSDSNCNLEQEDISLYLPEGWSLFGYTCLESIDVLLAFESIVDRIIVVKDSEGDVYIPEWNFNGIGDLIYSTGYQIKTTDEILDFSFCSTITGISE